MMVNIDLITEYEKPAIEVIELELEANVAIPPLSSGGPANPGTGY